MSRLCKLIFVTFIGAISLCFVVNVWCLGSREERILLGRVADSLNFLGAEGNHNANTRFNRTVRRLRPHGLYRNVIRARRGDVNRGTVYTLIRRFPGLAIGLLQVAENERVADDNLYNADDSESAVEQAAYIEHLLLRVEPYNSDLDLLGGETAEESDFEDALDPETDLSSASDSESDLSFGSSVAEDDSSDSFDPFEPDPEGTYDFHGLGFGAAYVATHLLVREAGVGEEIRIIVGRGTHTGGDEAVVRTAVELFATKMRGIVEKHREPRNPGVLVLRLVREYIPSRALNVRFLYHDELNQRYRTHWTIVTEARVETLAAGQNRWDGGPNTPSLAERLRAGGSNRAAAASVAPARTTSGSRTVARGRGTTRTTARRSAVRPRRR